MVEAADLLTALKLMQARTKLGIDKALASNRGISPAYFYYDCVDYIPSDKTPMTATPKGFKLNTLPLFLEGPARHLKVIHDISRRREIYSQTKNSALYDEHLKMFKISGSLKDMGQDVGRMKAFSPGWLENESIWLHMSYKWYLELLRGGLYEEFFTEMKTGLVPFMPADVYGRNPVEASSFIVSSAFPDPKLHGAGFLARLSGSTAEFMSMWAIMMMGQFPFVLGSDGKVALALKPVLPGWMFTASDNTVSFTFLSSTLVTYHNPSRIDTWKLAPKSATVQFGSKEKYDVPTPEAFSAELSVRIRNAEATKIDVFF